MSESITTAPLDRLFTQLHGQRDRLYRTVVDYIAEALNDEVDIDKATQLAGVVVEDYVTLVQEVLTGLGWKPNQPEPPQAA